MSTGAFHEGLNFAAVQRLPLIVVCENNGYAYSTPMRKQTAVERLCDRALAYGIPGAREDGNDVLAVHAATRAAVERARTGGGASLIELVTYRRLGHAEHDDQRYVPRTELEYWSARDPLERYASGLADSGVASRDVLAGIDAAVHAELEEAEARALAEPLVEARSALDGVYAPKPS
jgi:pyruvate dehydrogenase E1 component alpha subunit/2-oxoisovalerate dehydrogenase E1 component alpha subunit